MKKSAISTKKINLLYVLALIAGNTLAVSSVSAIALVNPSFESDSVTTLPVIAGGSTGNEQSAPAPRAAPGFVITNESNITGWRTTATDNGIELWQSGFLGVTAAPNNGGQFAEVNGREDSSLFQNLTIAASGSATPLYFNFWHRARENSGVQTNVVRLIITDVNAGLELFNATFATQLDPNDINATNNGWANYRSDSFASFSAAAGVSRDIRFEFDAIEGTFVADRYQTTGATPTSASNFSVTTTNANAQTGNFLDNANFSDDPATAVPFDFSPNLAIGALGGLYLGSRVLKSLKKKKDIN